MTKSSKVESPTTWPFILSCLCFWCFPMLVFFIAVIIASANKIEGSKKDDKD